MKSSDNFGSLNTLIGSFETPDTSNAPFVTSMKTRYGPGWFQELKNRNLLAPLTGSGSGGRTESLGSGRRDGHSEVHGQRREGRPRSQQDNNDPINVRPFHGSSRLNHTSCSVGTPTKKGASKPSQDPSFCRTSSLTAFPSTGFPANFAIAAFITTPMSLIEEAPVSAIASATAFSRSSAVAAVGM